MTKDVKKITSLELVVYENENDALKASFRDGEKVFIHSSYRLNTFSIEKMVKGLVLPIPKDVVALKKKNVTVEEFDQLSGLNTSIEDTPFNILKRNLFNQIKENVEYVIDNMDESNKNTLYLSQMEFVLFFWYLVEFKNKYQIDDIEVTIISDNDNVSSESELENYISNGIEKFINTYVNERFYLFSLERLIKLYGLLYASKEATNEAKIFVIASFQEQLLNIKELKNLNPLLLEEIVGIFEQEVKYLASLYTPNNNFVNKILEQLKKLQYLIQLDKEGVVKKGNDFGYDYYLIENSKIKSLKKQLKDFIFYEGEKTEDIESISPF